MQYCDKKSESDLPLILRDKFLNGDENAFSSLYTLYAKRLYTFGMSICNNKELTEDAIHDIFTDIYLHRELLLKVINLDIYIIISFRNRLFFLIRKMKKYSDLDLENLSISEDKNYEDEWIENEIEIEKKKTVDSLFEQLNENQREVIYHRFIAGLSCQEISKIMGINYQSVKNLIHRSIKKIRLLKTTIYSLILLALLHL